VNGFIEGQYGSYNDVRLQAAVNIPITDDLAIRIATDDENRDTWYHTSFTPGLNLGLAPHFTGNDGNLHTMNGRISVLWQPTQKFSAELKLDGNYIDHGAPLGAPYEGPSQHIFDVSSDAHLMGIDQQIRGVLHMNYEFDNGITLKSISSEQLGVVKFNFDGDGTDTFYANSPVDFAPSQVGSIGKAEVMSQELNLVSPDTGRFTWVLGAVWLEEQIFVPRLYESALPGGTLTSGAILAATHGFYREDNWGIFGQGVYALTDALKLQVGLRYSSAFENFNAGEAFFINGIESPVPTPINTHGTTSDSKLTGKIDLDYQLDDNNFLYAFAATGHKAAGLNGDGTKYTGENVTDYEVGLKGTYFDGHVQTQLGGYYDDYSDFIMDFFDPLNALGTAGGEDLNVPGTTVTKGIEAQAEAVFGGLSVNLGVSHEDTSIPTFFAIDARNPLAGLQNLSGRPLPNAPKWTAQAGIQYAFDLGDHQTLTPRLDYGLTSSQWGTVFQLPGGNPFLPDDRLAARNLFNGLITYNCDKWQVALYGTNIFDQHYVASELWGRLGFPGDPQQFGIRVTKAF
jgi:iron complex outermembrane receptor protein